LKVKSIKADVIKEHQIDSKDITQLPPQISNQNSSMGSEEQLTLTLRNPSAERNDKIKLPQI
jgi:hypothetical protein